MPIEKRKRSVNFSTEEKIRFLRILMQRGKVIITKVNAHDLHTNRMKEDAWTEIMDELNATGSIPRTKDTLKKLWQKLKTEVRSISQTNGTEEGESRFDDPALEMVADIIGYGSSSGGFTYSEFESVYDESQMLNIKQERKPAKKRRHSESDLITIELEEVTPDNTPRISSNYRFETERLKNENEKKELILLHKQHMQQEHEVKVKHAELKTKILECVLQKIQDERPVDAELLKMLVTLK